MKDCKTCGSRLVRMFIGDLGHGGSLWLECPNECSDIFDTAGSLD